MVPDSCPHGSGCSSAFLKSAGKVLSRFRCTWLAHAIPVPARHREVVWIQPWSFLRPNGCSVGERVPIESENGERDKLGGGSGKYEDGMLERSSTNVEKVAILHKEVMAGAQGSHDASRWCACQASHMHSRSFGDTNITLPST